MSDHAANRAWELYLNDMIVFCENALDYTQGLDQARFVSTRLNYDATIRNIELIGEAATRIPQYIRDASPQIGWRQIIATRNRLIHAYLGIDNDTLWSIIEDDIPILLNQLQTLKQTIDNET